MYDANGRNTSIESYRDGALTGKATVEYDAQNTVVKLRSFNTKNELITQTLYKYDSKNNLVESVSGIAASLSVTSSPFLKKDEIDNLNTITFDYNERNEIIGVTLFYFKKSLFKKDEKSISNKTDFVLNDQGLPVETTNVTYHYADQPPRISKTFASYNEHGDAIKSKYYESLTESNVPKDIREKVKVIDNKGTVKYYLTSDRPGMIMYDSGECDYEYDSNGNWTKKIYRADTSNGSKSVTIQQRIISYY